MVDPPWSFKSYTKLNAENWSTRRDAEKHYSVMSVEAIAALPVKQLAARDAHLFLWVTGPFLPAAFDVMSAWGFRFSSVAFTWVKLKKRANAANLTESDLHVGLGLTTRKSTELCLLGRRGNPRRMSRSVREAILSPVREHSRKPDEACDRVVEYCDGPYLELFARQSRRGWTTWGNESTKFDE